MFTTKCLIITKFGIGCGIAPKVFSQDTKVKEKVTKEQEK